VPIYVYHCACGVTFDARRRMADRNTPVPCPVCSEQADRTKVNPETTFVLRGRGWAADGYGGGK